MMTARQFTEETAMTLEKLAARCETAAGPDRELDAAIALTQGWTAYDGDNWIGPQAQICVPEYTASLDVAMGLVPTYRQFTCGNHGLTEDRPFARIGPHGSYASTPALALCAAALRAREAR